MTGFCYAITDNAGAVKIGWGSEPERRLSEINVGAATKYDLAGYVAATRDQERELHRLLRPWRIRGEWFRITGAPVRYFIETVRRASRSTLPRASIQKSSPWEFPIFEKLGGQDEALKVLEKSGKKVPSRFAVKKWRANKRIPAKVAFVFMEECERRGIDFRPADCELVSRQQAAE